MPIEKLAIVLPVDDFSAAVAAWTTALGTVPTFVDEPRWAQYDLGGTRLALSGTDRVSNLGGVMAKVADLSAERTRLEEGGLRPGPVETGPHERRMTTIMPSGAMLVLYEPL
jgi:hypothetical protein